LPTIEEKPIYSYFNINTEGRLRISSSHATSIKSPQLTVFSIPTKQM